MISVRSGLRILATTSPVDFRRGMDSLAMLVTEALRGDPFCGDLVGRQPAFFASVEHVRTGAFVDF
jgi:hypothetical protein